MKEQIRQISKFAGWTAFLALLCSFFTFEMKAQKGRSAPKPEEVWYLSFEVTIKGDGERRSGNKDELLEQWKIDRSYSGVIELNISVPTSIDVNKNMSAREII